MTNLTKKQKTEIETKVEDIFENEYDSKEFIRDCVYEHFEKEV